MVSSFHPHSMCKRVERVTAKNGRTSCTNWTIAFGVSGFLTRTHLLHGHFIFLNLLRLQTFLRSVRTIQSDVINFQHFLTSFAIFSHLNSSLFLHSVCIIQSDVINFQHVLTSFALFQSFTDLFRELNDGEIGNHYKMNSENVGTWHGIVISPA